MGFFVSMGGKLLLAISVALLIWIRGCLLVGMSDCLCVGMSVNISLLVGMSDCLFVGMSVNISLLVSMGVSFFVWRILFFIECFFACLHEGLFACWNERFCVGMRDSLIVCLNECLLL